MKMLMIVMMTMMLVMVSYLPHIKLRVIANTLETTTRLKGQLEEFPGILQHSRVTQKLGNGIQSWNASGSREQGAGAGRSRSRSRRKKVRRRRILTTIVPGLNTSSLKLSHSFAILSNVV